MKKRLFFDFEMSKATAWVWGTGKMYLGYHQIMEPQKIISAHWKWEHEDEVKHIHWGLNKQCDKRIVKKMVKLFNEADEVIAHNGDRFDIKKLYGRAMFHKIEMRPKYISRDTYKMVKSIAYLDSYSLKYCCQYFGLPLKLDSGGFKTWDEVQFNKSQEALDHLLYYGDGDIVSLEALFNYIRPYYFTKQHYGDEKYHCPECDKLGQWNKRYKTASGTVLHYMKCKDKLCNTYWKVNNKTYQDFIQYKLVNNIK